MDAVKFIEEHRRMCRSFGNICKGCPANIDDEMCKFSPYSSEYGAAEQIKLVEEWSAAHPRKTRQSIFMEQYPQAMCVDGILVACPKVVDKSSSCSTTCFNCAECRRDFWGQEVE